MFAEVVQTEPLSGIPSSLGGGPVDPKTSLAMTVLQIPSCRALLDTLIDSERHKGKSGRLRCVGMVEGERITIELEGDVKAVVGETLESLDHAVLRVDIPKPDAVMMLNNACHRGYLLDFL